MKYRKLGNTDLDVSVICLGTMTWGEQNTEQEAHEQLDYAMDQGINFYDTAEMYPVPPVAETCTRTEEYIGRWPKMKTHRDKIIMATKASGPGMDHIRGGANFSKKQLKEAIEGSLKRLQTDYVDLYQLHWPERSTNYFGRLGFESDPHETYTPIEEVLETLKEIQDEGKVRYFGLSNETPWGTMEFLRLAKEKGLPRMMSVQNPYNLLNRTYEIGMAEVSVREKCGLLAYSPLAFGTLTGKYLNDQKPPKARLTLWDRFDRYTHQKATIAVAKYVAIANNYDVTPAQLALAYVNSREFLTSNIIGATTMEQLKENISSIEIELSNECITDIEGIHRTIPNPCP